MINFFNDFFIVQNYLYRLIQTEFLNITKFPIKRKN